MGRYLLRTGAPRSAELSGDPKFDFNRGVKLAYIAPWLVRPLSLKRTYALMLKLVGIFFKSELTTVNATDNSAVLQWRIGTHLAGLPEMLHNRYMYDVCQVFQGVFSEMPRVHSNLLPAQIHEIKCQARGDDCCEWEFTWETPESRGCLGRQKPVVVEHARHREAGVDLPRGAEPAQRRAPLEDDDLLAEPPKTPGNSGAEQPAAHDSDVIFP
jgi:hypothetical protein